MEVLRSISGSPEGAGKRRIWKACDAFASQKGGAYGHSGSLGLSRRRGAHGPGGGAGQAGSDPAPGGLLAGRGTAPRPIPGHPPGAGAGQLRPPPRRAGGAAAGAGGQTHPPVPRPHLRGQDLPAGGGLRGGGAGEREVPREQRRLPRVQDAHVPRHGPLPGRHCRHDGRAQHRGGGPRRLADRPRPAGAGGPGDLRALHLALHGAHHLHPGLHGDLPEGHRGLPPLLRGAGHPAGHPGRAGRQAHPCDQGRHQLSRRALCVQERGRHRGGRGHRRPHAGHRARGDHRAGGPLRRRQVHHVLAPAALLRR